MEPIDFYGYAWRIYEQEVSQHIAQMKEGGKPSFKILGVTTFLQIHDKIRQHYRQEYLDNRKGGQ